MSSRIDRYLDGSWQYMLPNALGKKVTIILKNGESFRGKFKFFTDTEITLATRANKTAEINKADIQEVHLEHKAKW